MNLIEPEAAILFIAVGALVLAPLAGEWLAIKYMYRKSRKARD